MPIIDPTYCKRKILDLHGEYGARWLAQLPNVVAECAERWSLEVMPPFAIESFSYVAPAVREDGEPVVLKVAVQAASLVARSRHYGIGTALEFVDYWRQTRSADSS